MLNASTHIDKIIQFVKPVLFGLVFSSVLAISSLAQVRDAKEQTAILTAQDSAAVVVPPGTVSYLVPITVDAPADKRDSLDVVSSESAAVVSLVAPTAFSGCVFRINNIESVHETVSQRASPANC